MSVRIFICCGLLLGLGWVTSLAQEKQAVKSDVPAAADKPATPTKNDDSDVARELFSGKVVLLPEALKRKGIKSYPEMKDQVVLETDSGELLPIVSDWRGRAFFQDERLRNRQVDLVARKRPGVPYLQVLMIFTFDEKGERQYTDYWCDICSIPMYEIKDCECCQGPIRLRMKRQDLPSYIKAPKKEPGK